MFSANSGRFDGNPGDLCDFLYQQQVTAVRHGKHRMLASHRSLPEKFLDLVSKLNLTLGCAGMSARTNKRISGKAPGSDIVVHPDVSLRFLSLPRLCHSPE